MKEGQEANTTTINQLQANIRRLEKEKNSLNERLEISSKSMMSEQGGLEKKIERVQEERDRLKDELDLHKADKDKKIEEMEAVEHLNHVSCFHRCVRALLGLQVVNHMLIRLRLYFCGVVPKVLIFLEIFKYPNIDQFWGISVPFGIFHSISDRI